PAVLEDLIVALDEVAGGLMRRMARRQREPEEPGCVGLLGRVPGQKPDRLVDEVGCQGVAARVRAGGIDARIVAHELWSVLVGCRIHKAVETIETAAQWPPVERTRGAGFRQGRDVPFAHHVVAGAMRPQTLGERASLLGDLAAIAREAAVEVREAADTDGVVIAPRQQGRTRCRTHGRGVEARIAPALRSKTIYRGGVDGGAVTPKIRET